MSENLLDLLQPGDYCDATTRSQWQQDKRRNVMLVIDPQPSFSWSFDASAGGELECRCGNCLRNFDWRQMEAHQEECWSDEQRKEADEWTAKRIRQEEYSDRCQAAGQLVVDKGYRWIQCHTCGSRGLLGAYDPMPMSSTSCGGCNDANWFEMRTQQGKAVNEGDWVYELGVDYVKGESGCQCHECARKT